MDSDCDSDFYGDEQTTAALHERVTSFDPLTYLSRQHPLLSKLHPNQPPTNLDIANLPNPYADHPGAWQFTEPISAFLARLPAATTDYTPGLDWLWVANPYHSWDPSSHQPQLLSRFIKAGRERLALFDDFRETASKTTAASRAKLDRDIAKARRETVSDLTDLAVACNVLAGKWMLFPMPGEVNEVWGKVARATAAGTLGMAAKVDTRTERGKERLICVYTKDFRDKEDVARVLGRLRELGLVQPDVGRQIYYKTDAWTELGIYSNNRWGVAASLHSSNEIFGFMRKTAPVRR